MSLGGLWMEDGAGGPARDLGATTSRTRFPLRNSELPSTHTRHHILMRSMSQLPQLVMHVPGVPSPCPGRGCRGAQAGGMRGSGPPAQLWHSLTCLSVTESGELGCRIPTAGSAQPWRMPQGQYPCHASGTNSHSPGTASLFLMPPFSPIL